MLDVRTLDLVQRPCWLFDPAACRMLHANCAALELCDAPSLAAFLSHDASNLADAVRAGTAKAMAQLAEGSVLQEQLTLFPGCRPAKVDALLSGVRLPDGRLAILIEGRAIPTHEARALDALRQLPVLVSLFDADGRALFRNPAAALAYGDRAATFTGPFDDLARAQALWDRAWAGMPVSAEMLVRTAAGLRWQRMDARCTTDPAFGRTCLLVTEQDIQAEVAARAEIEHRATHDALTNLANRTLFRRRLDDVAAEADRHGHPFSVMLVDLDHFKAVNDTLGHDAGDALLRAASGRMHEVVRRTDTLARLGGDEFGVLLPGVGCKATAAKVAAALINRVGSDYDLGGARVSIGASVGIALHDGARGGGSADWLDEIIRSADRALYGAKSAGRNTFRLAA